MPSIKRKCSHSSQSAIKVVNKSLWWLQLQIKQICQKYDSNTKNKGEQIAKDKTPEISMAMLDWIENFTLSFLIRQQSSTASTWKDLMEKKQNVFETKQKKIKWYVTPLVVKSARVRK